MPGQEEVYIYVMEGAPTEVETAPTEALRVPLAGALRKVDAEKFKETFEGIIDTIKYMAEKAQGVIQGYAVEEISLHLGISAEGGLAFVAKAGVQADIDIKLKKTDGALSP